MRSSGNTTGRVYSTQASSGDTSPVLSSVQSSISHLNPSAYINTEIATEEFWSKQGHALVNWYSHWDHTLVFDEQTSLPRWFVNGRLNVCYNCLDRHAESSTRNQAALIWQGDAEGDVRVYTYQMMLSEVVRCANVLKKHGIRKGDCVVLYMPMVPELAIAMLACARIGAVHCVVFAGFSSFSLAQKMQRSKAKLLVTVDCMVRAGRVLPIKIKADEALAECPGVERCIVVSRTGEEVAFREGRDFWYHEELASDGMDSSCPPEEVEANDPLFILFTSGSTGKPKGVVHSSGGYLVYAIYTSQVVFGLNRPDVHWCTADLAWISGHTYLLYGPLGLGVTTMMFEGTPSYPGPDRYWRVVEKFRVNVVYTSPVVIRALMRYGNEPADIHDLSSLRLLGSVGEPIGQYEWLWYHNVVGRGRIPVIDTWIQTETGGVMISPQPYSAAYSPGAAMAALPGIQLSIVDEESKTVQPGSLGRLVFTTPWPGMLVDVCEESGINTLCIEQAGAGLVFQTGDAARFEADNTIRVTARLDDLIARSGYQLSPAEIEASLITHPAVMESAVVQMENGRGGSGLYAYVVLRDQAIKQEKLYTELRECVASRIGELAVPDIFHVTVQLPKTRSGKIMRRLLKKIASGEYENFGDTTALANPSVLQSLIAERSDV